MEILVSQNGFDFKRSKEMDFGIFAYEVWVFGVLLNQQEKALPELLGGLFVNGIRMVLVLRKWTAKISHMSGYMVMKNIRLLRSLYI